MIYGAQTDDNDYHKFGWTQAMLTKTLTRDLISGYASAKGHYFKFCNVSRVSDYKMPWSDTSTMIVAGHHISLNMIAWVCDESKPGAYYSKMTITNQAVPYVDPYK